MATTVCWETSTESWIVDNQEGDERFFDDKVDAINCAYDLEQNKDEPDCVLVYKKNGSGISENIPVSK